MRDKMKTVKEIGKILNIDKIENECPDWHKLPVDNDSCTKEDCTKCWNLALEHKEKYRYFKTLMDIVREN